MRRRDVHPADVTLECPNSITFILSETRYVSDLRSMQPDLVSRKMRLQDLSLSLRLIADLLRTCMVANLVLNPILSKTEVTKFGFFTKLHD